MDGRTTDRLVRRILRVDHAGEHGAVAIYSTQIAVLGDRLPELSRWLKETLTHEERHRAAFRRAMPQRAAKPCRALSIWSIGGGALGWLTGMIGPDAVLACTAVVERTVHGHLHEQAEFLERVDPALGSLVREIQSEEDEHLAFAEAHHDRTQLASRVVSAVVSVATEALIVISTRGDSLRLAHALKRSV